MSYFRVILRVPTALEVSSLSAEQQQAIQSVFGQFVMPMPGTQAYGGMKLVDAVTRDTFEPEKMALYGMNWPIVGMWNDLGESLLPFDTAAFMQHLPEPDDGSEKVLHEPHRWNDLGESLLPFDTAAFMQHLPEPDDGSEKVLHEPHRWAGWPSCFG